MDQYINLDYLQKAVGKGKEDMSYSYVSLLRTMRRYVILLYVCM